MEFAFEEKKFSHLQQIADEWLRQEETADIIVPDSYPDVVEIVNSFANVVVRSKECRAGSVLISGGVQAGILYLAQDETAPRLLETYMPFSMKKDTESCDEDTSAVLQCQVAGVDGRILNSRKIMLRVELGCSLQLYRPNLQTVFAPGDTDRRLQLHCQKYPLVLPLEVGEKLFSVEEEPELPANRPTAERILRYEVVPETTDVRLAGNRAVFKGNIRLNLLYQTPEGQLERWETQLPFSQFCDLGQSYEEEDLKLNLQLTGCDVNADGLPDDRRITVNLMLLAQCVVYGHQLLEIVDDAYWLGGSIQAKVQPCSVRCLLDQQILSQSMRVSVPGQIHTVHDVQIHLGRPEIQSEAGTVHIRVPVTVQLCASNADGQISGSIARTFAEFSQTAAAESQCRAAALISGEVYAIPGPDGAEVRFSVDLRCQWNALCSFESICGVTVQDETPQRGNRPSVILRTLGRDTSVWELAKACNTTQDRICKANDINDDIVRAGTLLLMPLA